jgi:FAD/FMN-containing dehydrogenase
MGLTGIILTARIQLQRVETAYVNCTEFRCRNLDELLERSETTNVGYRYSVAWVDCLASGARLGRGVLMLANDASRNELPVALRASALLPRMRRTRSALPLPSGTLNRWTAAAFNALFYARHASGTYVIDYDRYFYPLDSLDNWNVVYGRRGFIQYQAVIPEGQSRSGLVALLENIAAEGAGSFLAVLKRSGPASPGPLSFLIPGHTLALDMPNRGAATYELVQALDRILLRHGGRVYLAKDALTEASVFREMYPRLERFRRVKAGVDPYNLFVSSQARRLGIVLE